MDFQQNAVMPLQQPQGALALAPNMTPPIYAGGQQQPPWGQNANPPMTPADHPGILDGLRTGNFGAQQGGDWMAKFAPQLQAWLAQHQQNMAARQAQMQQPRPNWQPQMQRPTAPLMAPPTAGALPAPSGVMPMRPPTPAYTPPQQQQGPAAPLPPAQPLTPNLNMGVNRPGNTIQPVNPNGAFGALKY
jgi:hypothetical protein